MDRNMEYAEKIMDLSREELSYAFPFLTPAIYGLDPKACPGSGIKYAISRGGDSLLYDPEGLIEDFMEEKDTAAFFLHSVLHCLLFHPFFSSRHGDRALWDISCDICVRDIMRRLGKEETTDEMGMKEGAILRELEKKLPVLNADGVYSVLERSSVPPGSFYIDDHALWYALRRDDRQPSDPGIPQKWERIAGEVELSIQRSGRDADGRGDLKGYLLEILDNIERRYTDYSAFLERFGSDEEVFKIDPDSFDHSLYTYGIELYGDMPLIEPLEYCEKRNVREFAVAIDTSLSCSTELIRHFLEKTYDILFMSMEPGERKKMIIFQCDMEIKDETVICDREELKRYMSGVSVRGGGGTDFRPVFSRIEELMKESFSDLKGLLYFTDGDGVFPEIPPKYKTAFVMPYGRGFGKIPPWAMKAGLSV